MNVDELSCKSECDELMARYFVSLDAGERDRLIDLFTDDAAMPRPGGGGQGKPAIRELVMSLPANFKPVHLAVNRIVTRTGPDTASGLAYVVTYNMFAKEGETPPLPIPQTPTGIGKINFEFRRTPEGWRITKFQPQGGFGVTSARLPTQ